jgi:transposase
LRYQLESGLAQWFRGRVGELKGRTRRIAIVAMARKLLVAIWRFITVGIVPEGAILAAWSIAMASRAANPVVVGSPR